MSPKILAVLFTIFWSMIGVLGDYFLKLASQEESFLKSRWFYIGLVIYSSTAFGWVYVMRHLKLSTIGVLYSVAMVIFLTLIGTLFFKESLKGVEVLGILMGLGSLVLLTRFA